MKPIMFAVVLVGFLSCKTKSYTPLNYNKNILVLGNGGGFTGMSTSYYIMESGDVFRSGMNDTSYIKVGKLDPKIIEQQFSAYQNLKFSDVVLNDPGNRYFFLNMKSGGKEHMIQWGRSELENQNLAIYHKNIMSLIKRMDSKVDTN